MLRASSLTAAVVVCLTLTACGSSTTTTAAVKVQTSASSAAPVVTAAEFIAAADRICTENHRQVAPLERDLSSASSGVIGLPWARLAVALSRAQALQAGALRELQALPEPAAERPAIRAWLNATARQRDGLGSILHSVEAQSLGETITAEGRVEQDVGVAKGLAEAYGLKACAS